MAWTRKFRSTRGANRWTEPVLISVLLLSVLAVLVDGAASSRGYTSAAATDPNIRSAHSDQSLYVGTPGTVAAATDATGGGWTVNDAGAINAVGAAVSYGSASGIHLNHPVVGMAPTPDGDGYWLAASDGGIFSFGDSQFYGSTGSLRLNRPIVGMAATPSGHGYWLVASDGGIFSFGDAEFYGSAGGVHLNQPVVGMAVTPDGGGYWLVASDGGIFTYGDAQFYGSAGGIHLNQPVVGMAVTPDGDGYWLVASDGGIFTYGDAQFYGSAADQDGPDAVSLVTNGSGYAVVSEDGQWTEFGPTGGGAVSGTSTPSTPSGASCIHAPRPAGDGAPMPCVVGNALVDAAAGTPLRLVGVDASGTEDACIQDGGNSYGPSDSTEAGAIASWHANVVRVPLNEDCWLGINGAPAQYSGAPYQAMIEQWVSDLNRAGLVVILDLHWSAPGSEPATEQWPMADADHSINFWSQVAARFAGDPSVIFDLFNEPMIGQGAPSATDWACWLKGCLTSFAPCPSGGCAPVTYETAGMQELVDAVREAGADQPLMIGGLDWSGDPCGINDAGGNGGTCQWLANEPSDPDHQIVASFHTYNWTGCATVDCWDADVAPVAERFPVVAGEIGESDCSANFINTFMEWADDHDVSYLAWSWQPPGPQDPTSCVVGTNESGGSNNLNLLASWDGTPNAFAPEGGAFARHLSDLAAGGGP